MKGRWLIKHNRGWCAAKTNRKWDESAFNVETLCDHFVVLPLGCKRGEPTCEDCLRKLYRRGENHADDTNK
jgi:hypothetical protein